MNDRAYKHTGCYSCGKGKNEVLHSVCVSVATTDNVATEMMSVALCDVCFESPGKQLAKKGLRVKS